MILGGSGRRRGPKQQRCWAVLWRQEGHEPRECSVQLCSSGTNRAGQRCATSAGVVAAARVKTQLRQSEAWFCACCRRHRCCHQTWLASGPAGQRRRAMRRHRLPARRATAPLRWWLFPGLLPWVSGLRGGSRWWAAPTFASSSQLVSFEASSCTPPAPHPASKRLPHSTPPAKLSHPYPNQSLPVLRFGCFLTPAAALLLRARPLCRVRAAALVRPLPSCCPGPFACWFEPLPPLAPLVGCALAAARRWVMSDLHPGSEEAEGFPCEQACCCKQV